MARVAPSTAIAHHAHRHAARSQHRHELALSQSRADATPAEHQHRRSVELPQGGQRCRRLLAGLCRWRADHAQVLGWGWGGIRQSPAHEVAPVGLQRVRFDRRLDDDHVPHDALSAPGFGGIWRVLAGAFEHEGDVARLETILNRKRRPKQRQPEGRCD